MGEKSNIFSLKAETDGEMEFFSLFEELHWLSEFNQTSHPHSFNNVPILIHNFDLSSLDKLRWS